MEQVIWLKKIVKIQKFQVFIFSVIWVLKQSFKDLARIASMNELVGVALFVTDSSFY